ncbi:MAG TPA: hypothetical protein DCM87_18460 [Planctomycetes bacterium]|nr:hypothetical protein [Planctomycetota bacterium]
MPRALHAGVLAALCGAGSAFCAAPLSHAWYRVLPADEGNGPPFHAVAFAYGPAADGGVAWELEVRKEDAPAEAPLFALRCVTARDPLAGVLDPREFTRYRLRIGARALEYRDAVTGRAALPGWGEFTRRFVPCPAKGADRTGGFPHTCEYLGHVLTLRWTAEGKAWADWPDTKTLALDGEMLVGTGRVFKDAEGARLPQAPERRNYTYVNWTADDYRAMIAAGMNLFGIVPGAGEFIREEPVFHRGGGAGLSYPADLYRSNFVGPEMFMDEPACLMVGDKTVHTTLRYFTDAAALLGARVRAQSPKRVFALERELVKAGVSFGDMRLAQVDVAIWETRYETAFYQLAAGGAGFVHEGRYQLGEFNEWARASTGSDRRYTAEEMFRYHFAVMRGAARRFGKDWGTSIYGQADPALSPLAVTLAYDMGARYVWFWTSDHDHHLPWPEQLELARVLARHAAAKPRPSIRGPRPVLDKAIAIPYGYFPVLESPSKRRNAWDLWWVRELDPEGRNEASLRYRRLMERAFAEVNRALDAREDFDITVDDGAEIAGYRKVVRVGAE